MVAEVNFVITAALNKIKIKNTKGVHFSQYPNELLWTISCDGAPQE